MLPTTPTPDGVPLLSAEELAHLASAGRCEECGHSLAFHYTDDFSLHGYWFCRVCADGNCDGDESDEDETPDERGDPAGDVLTG